MHSRIPRRASGERGVKMPWSALPEQLRSAEAWKGTDWDNPFQRWLLRFKGWFAFGWRASEGWARWRRYPKVLFAKRGWGRWRLESDEQPGEVGLLKLWTADSWYVSRVQYWCRWSVQVQWPLFFAFHVYWKRRDVPLYPKRPNTLGIGKLFFFYVGAHRDADGVYWVPSVYVGGVWK